MRIIDIAVRHLKMTAMNYKNLMFKKLNVKFVKIKILIVLY